MSAIILKSPPYEIVAINRKTAAATMRDWRVGDRIRFSTVTRPRAGASGGGVYASDFTATNSTQGTHVTKSQTQLSGFFGFGGESFRDSWATFTIREINCD